MHIMNISTDIFNVNTKGDVTYLTIPNFNVRHGISTRFGGVSEGYFSSMNLGMNTTDDASNVFKNFEMFCDAIGVDYNSLVLTKQTHNTYIKRSY